MSWYSLTPETRPASLNCWTCTNPGARPDKPEIRHSCPAKLREQTYLVASLRTDPKTLPKVLEALTQGQLIFVTLFKTH